MVMLSAVVDCLSGELVLEVEDENWRQRHRCGYGI